MTSLDIRIVLDDGSVVAILLTPVLSMRKGSPGFTLTTLHTWPPMTKGLIYMPMISVRILARISGLAVASMSRMTCMGSV